MELSAEAGAWAIADRFFDAIEADDMAAVAALYADDLRVWHSYDGAVQDKAQNLATLSGIAVLGVARYHVIDRVVEGGRIAQRHVLTITAHEGAATYHLKAAIFLSASEGRITAIDEYIDSREVDHVVRAIQAAAAASSTRRHADL